ncbi:helix-turn-helix transcriptional regulator [Nonomuraea sp. NPDC050783]|uniref:helix-turn-helix transcriptional regulator n=1 Tax=Nonomuraea sp. NPDC050783 TaxID=3154634 RepID=UPI0034656D01
MADTTTLGEFLRLRRGRLKPQDVGIASYGERRVPGLRREELAQLAGVSVTYYTRLEQGQSHRASESVIEALARALELSDDERIYLHNLARPRTPRPHTPTPATVRRATRQLIDSLQWPAVMTGPRTEVLAWNPPGHRLLAGHLDQDAPDRVERRPNLTRMLFLDAHHRDLYPHWDTSASCAVASLRLTVSRHPDDTELAALTGELIIKSEEFAALWSAHPVAEHASGPRHLQHPEIGELDLELETLVPADEPDHRLLIFSAAEGSSSQAALRLLWV